MDSEATLISLLWTLPWVLFPVVTLLRLKEPPELEASELRDWRPHVSVIVPARNEARSIQECVSSILRSAYESFDVTLLDDGSTDGTADLAREAAEGIEGGAQRLTVLTGAPLPQGWFGKPWACHQAAQHAGGDVLLFTDADTSHGPHLLERAVTSLDRSQADALTLIARQLMETFWERVVQPHVFFMIGWKYGDLRSVYSPALRGAERWREAIANGQFIMIRRDAYDAIDGHEAVKGEVVEDLRLAQEVVRSGRALAMRDARDAFATRMYRSFGDLAEGWTKNLWTGATQAFGVRGARLLTWAAVLGILGFWVGPFVVFGLTALPGGPPLSLWAAAAFGLSVVFWCGVMARLDAPFAYGVTFPLGALVVAGFLARSGIRGDSIEWKGRRYGRGVAGNDA